MATSDFLFYSMSQDSNTAHGLWHINRRQSLGNGGNGTDGKGALGAAVTNSSLSNPLSANDDSGNPLASTYARMFAYSKGQDYNGDFKGSGNTVVLAAAQGGDNYPTNNNTSGDYAYSCRAFMRLENPSGNGAQAGIGTNIMLLHKSVHDNGSTQFSSQNNDTYSTEFGGTPGTELDAKNGIVTGYQLQLKTQKNPSDGVTHANQGDSCGTNAVPVLQLVAPKKGDIDDQSDIESQTCSGTYAFNTWYHIRFDLHFSGGSDVLTAYTAPISGAGSAKASGIGNETWTQVGTMTVAGASGAFIAWNDDYLRHSGYAVTCGANPTNGASFAMSNGHDALIDRFQFLTKDVS